jgi:glycosyltransferase involved in cell wall biosynthesis
MLEPWALNHKPWKKRLAWLLYQRADLKRAHSLHATSELESQSLQRFGLGVSISVIPNGVEVPEIATLGSEERFQRERVALYMGRIHPKKGLPMLIEAWARLRPPGWLLRVVGPDESGQRAQLERSVHVAGLENVVSFAGPVEGKAKSAAFLNANILVLPTHSENFGIVVAEALAHGVPVLTTKGAPWSMIKERNCGWWVDATVDGVLGGLRAATSHDSERLRMMGANGRDWVRDEFEWKHIAKRFRAQYQKVLEEKETESEAW